MVREGWSSSFRRILGPAATFLYARWLPASGEELRDFPLYARRVRFFPDVPKHETITDLHLPVK